MKLDSSERARIQKALGASTVVDFGNPSQGPLDLLQLRSDFAKRLQSSGGRPTDPAWTVRRVVPFKQEGWQELEVMARKCSEAGQKVSPSQLAAWLIEHGLRQLKKSEAV